MQSPMCNKVTTMVDVEALAEARPVSVRRDISGYLLAGVLSYGVDVGALFTLHALLAVPLLVAASLAYLLSFLVNFSLNRRVLFKGGSGFGVQMARYIALCLVSYVVTLGVMSALVSMGIHYLVAKTLAVTVIAVGNFTVCRGWVFR